MVPSVKASPAPQTRISFLTRHGDLLLLLLLMSIVFFYRLGSYPLFDLDEPRYAEAAREMLERGNWVTPYFNYELRFDKPVFFYWLIAMAYQWFGLSEFSARFFSAVTGSATVLMVYGFGRHWISRQYGLISALILATSVMFIGISRMSITDMTLTCWMTATTLGLFMAAQKNLRWWLAAGFFAGLGILTKGPVAIVVPGAIFTLYTLLTGNFKRCLLNRWLPLALLICLGIALPWYILAYQENGQKFLDALFLHNVTRYSDVVSGHKQPFYFYAVVLLAGFFPWVTFLPAAVHQLLSLAKSHKAQVASQNTNYLLPLYAAIWAVFIFLFFSAGNTKLLTYILPLFPALALWVASVFTEKAVKSEADAYKNTSWRWLTIPAWVLVGITCIGGLVFSTQMDKLMPREAAGVQANGYNIAAVAILITGFIATTWQLNRKKAISAVISLVMTMSLLVTVALQGIVPNVSKAAQGVMMGYLQKIGNNPVVLYEIQRPSLTFYGKRRVPRFVEEQAPELLAELHKNKQTFIITKAAFVPQLRSLLPPSDHVRIVEKDRVYSLLSVSQAP
jgi:4-amino-4-deoxy-L-arabinose transferase-like glycosyltransferase